ncbi:hypothetical protein VFPFJ_03793 [Purpureocillium lilacinum]|uniref:Secreted protein n=1 Tax=Purpureocillium lilacinum TaxID=33203 RepID=A0A179HRR5_PURLI|nr:hypothetical protein VFPFJ_03793 [Purpureocillium lilacinum]OAQ92053.1 hypothetical protein VFPFJ_03793 [Purpureocillium lilacinum]
MLCLNLLIDRLTVLLTTSTARGHGQGSTQFPGATPYQDSGAERAPMCALSGCFDSEHKMASGFANCFHAHGVTAYSLCPGCRTQECRRGMSPALAKHRSVAPMRSYCPRLRTQSASAHHNVVKEKKTLWGSQSRRRKYSLTWVFAGRGDRGGGSSPSIASLVPQVAGRTGRRRAGEASWAAK